MRAPVYDRDGVTLYQGEALALLRDLPDASIDALVTDPPYSSGGFTRGDRMRDPEDKYRQSGGATVDPDFAGDNRDQRSFAYWSALWLSECLRIVKPGGLALVFTDWRQLPTTTDAIQAGGFVWRGIVPWDKGNGARPLLGGFRAQCEYVVWGTRGPREWVGACPQGAFIHGVNPRLKHHLCGKPIQLMDDLLAVLEPGMCVLDPFAGSGSTLIAARNRGLRAIGFELSVAHCDTATRLLAAPGQLSRYERDQASLFAAPA